MIKFLLITFLRDAVTGIQEGNFLPAVGIQVLEITHNLTDAVHHRKGIGILGNDPGQRRHLGFVDYAIQNTGFLAQIHTLGGNHGSGVLQLQNDLFRDFIGIIGNDLEPDRFPAASAHPVGDRAGGEGIQNAHNDRLNFVIINKIGTQCHQYIQGEDDPEGVLLRLLFVNHSCDKIRAAGVGAALDQNAVAVAEDDACHQGTHNGAGAGFRGIMEHAQIHPVKQDQSYGEGTDIDHAPHRQRLADEDVHQDGQGNIDHQAHITQTDAEDMLDHGADTVQTRRGELIGEDENLIIQRRNQGNSHDYSIS